MKHMFKMQQAVASCLPIFTMQAGVDHVVVKYRQSITSATNPEKAVQIYNARITKDSKKIFYRQRMWGLLKNGQIKIVVRNIRKYFIRDLVIMLGNSSKKKLCYALTRFE